MSKEVEYLKEHLYEIYKYKKSMKDLTYDMDIEHLLRACKALDYSQKEIERLNNIINRIDNFVDRTIEIIKQQPTGDDEWILEKLNGIKYLIELKESN